MALLIRIELVVLVLVGFVIPTLINLVRGPARQAYPDDPVKYVWGGEAVTLHAIWFSGTLDDARLWPNTTHDGQVVEAIHADLAQKHLLPSEHLVDTGYTDSDLPVSSRSQYGIELLGPVMGDTSWQARTVTSPEGHTSVNWCPTHDRHGNDVIHVEFAPADCRGCPSRPRCTRSATEPREMGLRPQEQQEALRKEKIRCASARPTGTGVRVPAVGPLAGLGAAGAAAVEYQFAPPGRHDTLPGPRCMADLSIGRGELQPTDG